jgi:pimeloyl-ACP methyl ester carboxylesterase
MCRVASVHEAVLRGGPARRAGRIGSAVLVLHGGQEHNLRATTSTQASLLRMVDMYAGLRHRGSSTAVYLLRHRVRGWNADPAGGAEPDPVQDARWALDRIGERHGDVGVALLGHSMGGRTAFAVAADRRVLGICALAPWLPDGEPLAVTRPGQSFVIAHGTADRMTSPPGSLRYAERLREKGARVARFELAGERHALLGRPRLWHRFAVSVTLGLAGDRPLPPAVLAALDDSGGDSLRRLLE